MTNLLITHEDCLAHDLTGHPERADRLRAILDRVRANGQLQDMQLRTATEVESAVAGLVHPAPLITALDDAEPGDGHVMVDSDTYLTGGSMHAARLAAGAVVNAVTTVLADEAERAFCAVRPPGHHAEVRSPMGFCLLNSVAIAAEVALQHPAVTRLAILDFDVHHCNGTVDVFKDRPEVLVCSSFQANYYPHRYLDFVNEHIVNTPLAAGTDSADFRAAIERDWWPALARHQPDLILVSAGFDAHVDDPLADLMLETRDYHWITREICERARHYCSGRVVTTLEGGYDLAALADSVEAHLAALID